MRSKQIEIALDIDVIDTTSNMCTLKRTHTNTCTMSDKDLTKLWDTLI